MSKKEIRLIVSILFLIVAFFTALFQNKNQPENTSIVSRVVDGDTIELGTGERVRYIGIDTPETVDPRKEVQCFGKEASVKNKELVEGKEVRLVKDVSDKDKYGRLLRYVYVGDVFVNEKLVSEGYARVATYPPDVAYAERFIEAERVARENKLGLWGGCGGV
jgi:micrococcal nuclease